MQGAAPMPPSLVHRWAELIGAERIVMAYGMTEGLGVTALRGDRVDEPRRQRRPWAAPGTELRILDDDGTDAADRARSGDIYLRSPFYGGSTYLGEAPRLRQTDDGFATVGRHGVPRRRRLPLPRRPARRHDHHRRRQRVPRRGRGGAHRPSRDRRRGRHRAASDAEWGRRVHAIIEPADPDAPPAADGGHRLRQEPPCRRTRCRRPIEIVDAIPRSEATKVNRGRSSTPAAADHAKSVQSR